MSRRLDIGIASYRNPAALQKVLASIERCAQTDWRCFIIHNPSAFQVEEEQVRHVIDQATSRNSRFVSVWMEKNRGYAGAVNEVLRHSETEYWGYLDNDTEVLTAGWDEKLCSYLDRFHEIGVVFPNGGAYPIDRGPYKEIMWGVGFAFLVNRLAACDSLVATDGDPFDSKAFACSGIMDEKLGHQEEADMCLRVRMAGWKCAAATEVHVAHHATATNDPASVERINRGVVNFVNRWTWYFGGKNLNYHSPNVLRWEDWPPNALYLEEYWRLKMPQLNASPEVVTMDGREYDLIKVPRFKDFYRNRII